MLLAEDLLLVLTSDSTGAWSALGTDQVDILLAGANLIELATMGRVEISHEVKPIRLGGIQWDRKVDRLIVCDPSPTGDDVLDAALQIAIRREGDLLWVIHGTAEIRNGPVGPGRNLHRALYDRFVSSGIVRHEEERRWFTKVDRWPVQDSKVQVRRRVIQALLKQTTPDTRSAALIALLHTVRHEPMIVGDDHLGVPNYQLVRRGEEIANSDWAPVAVRDSIDTVIATTGKEARRADPNRGG